MTKWFEKTIEFELQDAYGESKETLKGRVKITPNAVLFEFDGYGDLVSEPGGQPVLVEQVLGVPRVVVWSDINEEDPTHEIRLDDARESCRKSIPTDLDSGSHQ